MDLEALNQFPSVPATGIASLVTNELVNRSVHAIVLELGGTTFDRSHITNLSIRLGGKDILDGISATQLQKINDYDVLGNDVNYVTIFFGDATARTIRGQHLGDLDLSIYAQPLEIEVQISGATAPTLRAYAMHSVPKMAMGVGYSEVDAAQLRAVIRTVIQPSAAVSRKSYELSLGGQAGARLRRAAFFHANLTSLEYKKGSFVKHDDVSSALNGYIQENYARSAQAGLYMLDRIVDGNQGEAETTVNANGQPWNQQLSLTTSAGDTITAFADIHIAWALL
jgi:hypothetical protein